MNAEHLTGRRSLEYLQRTGACNHGEASVFKGCLSDQLDSGTSFVDGVSKNRFLQELDISHNWLGPAACSALVGALAGDRGGFPCSALRNLDIQKPLWWWQANGRCVSRDVCIVPQYRVALSCE